MRVIYPVGVCVYFFLNTLSILPCGPRREKTFRGVANNKGADQPAHQRSLISAFVISLLESMTFRLASSEISIFYLVSIAEQSGLNLALWETPKTGFVMTRPILCVCEQQELWQDCTRSSEPLLLANVISTKISCTGSNNLIKCCYIF